MMVSSADTDQPAAFRRAMPVTVLMRHQVRVRSADDGCSERPALPLASPEDYG